MYLLVYNVSRLIDFLAKIARGFLRIFRPRFLKRVDRHTRREAEKYDGE